MAPSVATPLSPESTRTLSLNLIFLYRWARDRMQRDPTIVEILGGERGRKQAANVVDRLEKNYPELTLWGNGYLATHGISPRAFRQQRDDRSRLAVEAAAAHHRVIGAHPEEVAKNERDSNGIRAARPARAVAA